MSPRSRLGLPLALVLAGGTPVAGAADWQFDPYVEAGAVVNDNYTLANADPLVVEIAGGYLDAGIQWRADTPRSRWVIEPRIRSSAYDEDQFDSTDFFFNLSGEQRSERSAFGVAAEFYDQDIVQGQLPAADFAGTDLGQAGGPDSGRILGDNRQALVRVRPFAEFDLSERVQLRVEGRAEDVSFDQNVLNAQVSYQTLGAAASLDRRFSPSSSFGLRLDYQQTEPELGFGKADLTGLQLQWDYRIAERVSAYVRGGARRSNFEQATVTPLSTTAVSETTPLLGAGVRWSFLKSELLLDAQREVDANSSGFVVQRNDLRVFYNHRFTVRFGGYLAAYFIDDDSVTRTPLYTPRRYYTGSAGLDWRFRQSLTLRGQIAVSSQKFTGEPSSADGNSARISVLYRPRRRD